MPLWAKISPILPIEITGKLAACMTSSKVSSMGGVVKSRRFAVRLKSSADAPVKGRAITLVTLRSSTNTRACSHNLYKRSRPKDSSWAAI